MTHLRTNELLGKKVYGNDGRLLGEVVGVAGRHGRVRAVVLRNDGKVLRFPVRQDALELRALD